MVIRVSILIVCSFFDLGCEINKRTDLYKDFDLFYLKPGDEASSRLEKYVRVQYVGNTPVRITYELKKRQVTLEFVDSFKLENSRSIYVYQSSNFLGGNSGPNKVYGTHKEENIDLVYVSRADTLLVTSQQVPINIYHDYDVHLFTRQNEGTIFDYIQSRNDEKESAMERYELYEIWLDNASKAGKLYRTHHMGLPPE